MKKTVLNLKRVSICLVFSCLAENDIQIQNKSSDLIMHLKILNTTMLQMEYRAVSKKMRKMGSQIKDNGRFIIINFLKRKGVTFIEWKQGFELEIDFSI